MITRYDIFIIIGLVAAGIVGTGIIRYAGGKTDRVIVQVDGKEVMKACLAHDRSFSVEGPLGVTKIEIKDEHVRVVDSPCKRRICVHTGWIHKPYQTIICAPNRVVISLSGGSSDDILDGITG